MRSAHRLSEESIVRMLVVDDDPQAEILMEMALADTRFERQLDIVTTAMEGLERIKADSYDIFLIDQHLPDGTGLQLIRDARDSGTARPIILLTGHGSDTLDDAALEAGATDYVEKHMMTAQLERAIRYALRDWRTARILHEREEQLRHAQKMEAIGRLAGGVAHDFNNLLTAVVGYTDLIRERLDPEDQTARDATEIKRAADRATALTRQLLAFSRKQILNPTVMDLNDTVIGLQHMLPRVIGEHIKTTIELSGELARIMADASQMDQVLVNLVVNARDAMPSGGQLTIATENVSLEEERIDTEGLRLTPGRYVMLGVSDTGTGMDSATRARAFEPFFTTKAKGKGTGLGLATVYGIVDQSGGGIAVDTAPGRGTSIRIYLPTTAAAARSAMPEALPSLSSIGSERILLVEDNDAVRELATKALRRRGYTVHDAGNAEEAIRWVRTATTKPQLLVTDVIMPGLSGPNLASRLLALLPDLRVLYMSGFTDDETPVNGSYWAGVPLLQKPFTPGQLAEQVRFALDSPVTRV